MNELKCPNCGTVFQIDEVDYMSIVKQVKDKEFEKEISVREAQYKNDKDESFYLKNKNGTFFNNGRALKMIKNKV